MKSIENKSDKSWFHFRSVTNFSKSIVKYNDLKADKVKIKLIEYFEIMEENNYSIDNRFESAEFYRKLLLPVGQYLIKQEGFRTKMDMFRNLVFGIFIDILLFHFINFYYFPLGSLVFFIIGYYKEKKAKESNRFFNPSW